MTDRPPGILVIANNWEERVRIALTLREAGFAAVPAADGRGAMAVLKSDTVAATVIAVAGDDGVGLMQRLRRQQPDLPVLLVLESAAMRLVDADTATVVRRPPDRRPLDLRQVLGCVFELVLREGDGRFRATTYTRAAELCIAAARLACLENRRAIAAAAGAGRVAQDLTRQIGEIRDTCRRFAVGRAAGPGGLALDATAP